MRGALEETLQAVLADRSDVDLVLVFGSRARGIARPGSDLDLAVLGKRVEILDLQARLSLALGVEVDVVDLRQAGYTLLKQVNREGRRVFERRPGVEGAWRAQTLAQLETDGPWHERMRRAFVARLAESSHG